MKLLNLQLSALEIHYLIKEMQFLVDSKVDKIFHPERNELVLQLHKTGVGKNLLKLRVPEYFCITETKKAAQQPSSFCVYLRKKLGNSFLIGIEQKEFERIIELRFKTKEAMRSLVFEFFSPGNIILVENGIIQSAIEYQEYTSRTIKPKEEYKYPEKEYNFLKLKEDELKEMLKKTNRVSLVKALAIDLGLGGLFAEEVCVSAGVDKDIKPKDVKKVKELFEELKLLRNKKISPARVNEDILPFELKSKKCEELGINSFNKAVHGATKGEVSEEEKLVDVKYKEKLKKIETMIKSQESAVEKLSKKEQEMKDKGDMIYANFQKIEQILSQVKQDPTKEMLEKLKQEKKIKDYNLKDKTITLELE
ncbi:NFACT family protein [Candidatus Woesearchaeota archaeon]|nr:NFACT family protein [Candidatus Woesearchaeota archaeon]